VFYKYYLKNNVNSESVTVKPGTNMKKDLWSDFIADYFKRTEQK